MNSVIDALMTRRSCRAFKPDAVPSDLIERIAACGLYAASAMNRQPWHIAMVTNAEVIGEIEKKCKEKMLASGVQRSVERAQTPGFSIFYGAPLVAVISGDTENKFSEGDCANVVQNMAVAAHALGLGSCYIAMFRPAYEDNAALAQKTLIPDGFKPFFTLAIGYRAQPDNPPAPRREGTLSYIH